ncbi:MAG: hypothetical protein JWL70_2648 [Acidimicrobiia bacterium]|nr:hypothetical protein [Acidimicrobiia bacterium]
MSFRIETSSGTAGAFHQRLLPDPVERAAWVHEVSAPALVLGSTQPIDTIDAEACAGRGVAVVRRRSGGSAVLLEPGGALWVDVILPAGDPQWDDDVGRSFLWLGQLWADALQACGAVDLHVHSGALHRTEWSPVLCFAGLGPGEVTMGGRKVVGISQRRTRLGARFQCAVLARWDVAAHVDLLAPSWRSRRRDSLATVAAGPGIPLSTLQQVVMERLTALPA